MVALPTASQQTDASPNTQNIIRSEITRTILRRATQTCDADGNCTTSGGVDTSTISIALGVAIPVIVAVGVLIYLHRRHVKKLKQEDREDKHGSLDFGLDAVPAKTRMAQKDIAPNFSSASDLEKDIRSGKGLSMDMAGSPYILPAKLHSSRESFHSLSKQQDAHDPYRPVDFVKDDAASLRRMRGDNSSIYTGSSVHTDGLEANLLRNAQANPRSIPPRGDSITPVLDSHRSTQTSTSSVSPESSHVDSISTAPTSHPNSLAPGEMNTDRDSYFAKNARDYRQHNKYLAALSKGRPVSGELGPSSPTTSDATQSLHAAELDTQNTSVPAELPGTTPYPRHSLEATLYSANHQRFASEASDYGDTFQVTPPSPLMPLHPVRTASASQNAHKSAPSETDSFLAPLPEFSHDKSSDNRRLSILRPLPPDDVSENPEERANRIRSFYKEYFDDSKPDPEGRYHDQPAYNNPSAADNYGDYGSEFLNEGTIFDPASGGFVVVGAQRPFADPITRRAMTPPPRAPPRFHSRPPPRGPHSNSTGPRYPSASSGFSGPSQRAHSSMGGVKQPKKKLPPPAPLTSLPTPHLLREDTAVFNALDFAPPTTYRDRQAGRRPDSPLGVARPFSPAVRAHTPLASSFDDLMVMPSPHTLRKSGTFTGLDFAPPRRFKDADTASDAGSIRSNRSNMSKVQLGALRAGAYRVSRIPKEVVGSKNDLLAQLKPTWDQRGVKPELLLVER